MPETQLTNVSDTARWVAAYRATESARSDAIFKDPLADRLAGERGRAIVAAAPRKLRSGWSIVTRTKLIDDLVLASVAGGCDRILNLAAGMDARPYRLALPAGLTWIEADLPAILEEKERLLAGERPVCNLIREKVDLSIAEERVAFLSRAIGNAAQVLVITEGLLGYLDDRIARTLGSDLHAHPRIREWILDLFSPSALAVIKGTAGHAASGMLKFAPADGVAFFERLGWRAREIQSIPRAALRLHRAPLRLLPLVLFPDPDPRRPGRTPWFGVVRLERGGASA